MARLPEEKINEIRQSVDIIDVIGSYLPLIKKGRNYVAVCPFHDDTNPSLSISPDKQIYKCFVCHKGGNVFTFLKDYLKISYIDAVKMVAEMGRVDISEYHFQERKKPVDEKLEPMYQMHAEATKIYCHYLNTKLGIEAKDYLNRRHMDQQVQDYFQIGYAPNDNILVRSFTSLHFNQIDMFKSGLVIESNRGYDRFQDRIMFPLHNQEGRVVGFSGRIFKKNQTDAKYMNSPESQIFIKGDMLYNYHRVKEEVRQAGYVYITEGFMDVIAFYKAGIKNVVALMGTAFTKGHLNALRRLTKHVYLCLDGDQAGKNATVSCIESLKENGFHVKVVELYNDMDPDELLQSKGKEEFLAVVKKQVEAIEFLMNYYFEKMNMENYEERKQYLEKIAFYISELEDEIDRDYYVQLLEKKSGFNKETIYHLVNHKKEKKIITKSVASLNYRKTKKMIDKYQNAERDLLHYMMEDKTVAQIYETKVGFMCNDIYRIIASYIVDYYRKNLVLEVADLINSITNEEIVKNIIEIAELKLPRLTNEQVKQEVIQDYIKLIKEKIKMIKIDELNKALDDTYDPKQQSKILQEIISLKERE